MLLRGCPPSSKPALPWLTYICPQHERQGAAPVLAPHASADGRQLSAPRQTRDPTDTRPPHLEPCLSHLLEHLVGHPPLAQHLRLGQPRSAQLPLVRQACGWEAEKGQLEGKQLRQAGWAHSMVQQRCKRKRLALKFCPTHPPPHPSNHPLTRHELVCLLLHVDEGICVQDVVHVLLVLASRRPSPRALGPLGVAPLLHAALCAAEWEQERKPGTRSWESAQRPTGRAQPAAAEK